MSPVAIHEAGIDDLEGVANLFDAYRQFHGQSADLPGARAFLEERLLRADSVVLVASQSGRTLGFTQLFPSFSSALMKPTYILNDLFVADSARRGGVARKLIDAACRTAHARGAVRLTLLTATDNVRAQQLYDNTGWDRPELIVFTKLLERDTADCEG